MIYSRHGQLSSVHQRVLNQFGVRKRGLLLPIKCDEDPQVNAMLCLATINLCICKLRTLTPFALHSRSSYRGSLRRLHLVWPLLGLARNTFSMPAAVDRNSLRSLRSMTTIDLTLQATSVAIRPA